jgi:hypothetical protein
MSDKTIYSCSPAALQRINELNAGKPPEPSQPLKLGSQETKYPFQALTVGMCFIVPYKPEERSDTSNRIRKAVSKANALYAPAVFFHIRHDEHNSYEVARAK